MERLTVKWKPKSYDMFDPVDVADNEYSKINFEKLLTKLGEYEDLEEQCIAENQCGLRELLLKWKAFFDDIAELYDYRKAEEQGLLLRLPCGVGDTVYYINFYQRKIEEDTVMEFSLETYDWYVRLRQNKWVILDMFKKNFFLTRKEAESALAEKGGA